MLAYIALGSNLNHPEQQIKKAVRTLQKMRRIRVLKVSKFYRSKPVPLRPQPDFINAACKIKTRISAKMLLNICQKIERRQHRVRAKKWRARTIDLDIIAYGGKIIRAEKLSIPHPQAANRAFVLMPLYEIEPTLVLPIFGKIRELLKTIDHNGLRKL